MTVEYRIADKKDLKQLVSKIKKAEFNPLSSLESKSVEYDLKNNKLKDYLVAVEKNKVLGFARFKKMSEERTHIGIFSIHKEHRYKGIGKELLKNIEQKTNTSHLTVGTYSPRSVEWFTKQGFELKAEKKMHPELKVSMLEKRL